MADTPDKAAALSDADLDEIVAGLEKDDGTADAGKPEGTESTSQGTVADEATGEPSETTETGEPEKEASDVEAGTRAADSQAEAPPTDEAPAVAPPPESKKPFTYKGAGQEFVLPGATEGLDGRIVIAKDGIPELRRRLANEADLSRNFTQYRRETERRLKAIQEQRSDKDIESDHIAKLFADVKLMTPDQRWDWAQSFDEQAPALMLKVERERLERDRKALERERKGPELSEEEQREQVSQVLTTELNATFDKLRASPDAKLLSQKEFSDLYQRFARKPNRLVVQAEADDPAIGAKKGDWVFEDDDIIDHFNLLVATKKAARANGGVGTAAARNAQLNADQRPANPIPPSVSGARPPVGGPPKRAKLAAASASKDRKGFRKGFLAGELDSDDE